MKFILSNSIIFESQSWALQQGLENQYELYADGIHIVTFSKNSIVKDVVRKAIIQNASYIELPDDYEEISSYKK